MNVNNTLSCMTRPQPSSSPKARFEHSRLRSLGGGTTLTSSIHDVTGWWNMNRYWLVRLNDVLAWLNPALGLVAAILAMLTIAVAAERSPRNAMSPPVPSARPVNILASAECARPVLPPELRDLRLYD